MTNHKASEDRIWNVVRYACNPELVRLGDDVRIPLYWVFKRNGVVIYAPGQSRLNEDMEFDGIQCVGIRDEKGTVWSFVVDPRTGVLIRNVRLVRRGEPPGDVIQPDDKLSF